MNNRLSLESQTYGIVDAFLKYTDEKGEPNFFTTPIDIYDAWEPRDMDEKELAQCYGTVVRDALLKTEHLLSGRKYMMWTTRLASKCIQVKFGYIPDKIDLEDPFNNADELFPAFYICPRFTKSSTPWTKTIRLYRSLGEGRYELNKDLLKDVTERQMSRQSQISFNAAVSPMLEHLEESINNVYPDRSALFRPLMEILKEELSEHFSNSLRVQDYIINLFGTSSIYTISMNSRKAEAEIRAYINDRGSSLSEYMLEWPTELENIDFLQNSRGESNFALVLTFNNGWKSEARISYPSTKISPSALGFTFSITKTPDSIYKMEASYKYLI